MAQFFGLFEIVRSLMEMAKKNASVVHSTLTHVLLKKGRKKKKRKRPTTSN
jgi:hypothetical protein